MEEPVRVQFGDAGIEVHSAQLRSERPDHPRRHAPAPFALAPQGVERRRAVQRHEYHQKAEEADEIVVVQVRGLVQQLDIGEQGEERRDGKPVAIAECYAQTGESKQGEVDVHSPGGPWLDPPEAGVREVVLRHDVEVGYPTLCREAPTDATPSRPKAMRNAAAEAPLTGRAPASAARSSSRAARRTHGARVSLSALNIMGVV